MIYYYLILAGKNSVHQVTKQNAWTSPSSSLSADRNFIYFPLNEAQKLETQMKKWLISCGLVFLFSKCFRYRDCFRRNCQLDTRRSTAIWVASAWQIARHPAKPRQQQAVLGYKALLHQDFLPRSWVLSPPPWFLLGHFYEALSQLSLIM